MHSLYRVLACSDHPVIRQLRRVYHAIQDFTLPAPRVLVKPLLWGFLGLRGGYRFVKRVFICEPLFKAYCRQHGRRVHTDTLIHHVQGVGDIIVGDDVVVDGKCGFTFAARFAERPTLIIGDHTFIGHDCSFTIGKRITIGRHCKLAADVRLLDSPGHSLDPDRRLADLPPRDEEVQPITIGDNVWIGRSVTVFPGITIGDNSVVGTGSIVCHDVPPNTFVAGQPARVIKSLTRTPAPDVQLVVAQKNQQEGTRDETGAVRTGATSEWQAVEMRITPA
jgi:acetyltransferase-like isoleucine patch superfamily enzyme